MNCVRAGTSSAHCETKNSSVLCGARSRWIKNKDISTAQSFSTGGGGVFFFFSQTEVVVSGLCVLDHTQTEKQGGCDSKIKLARCR